MTIDPTMATALAVSLLANVALAASTVAWKWRADRYSDLVSRLVRTMGGGDQ